MLSVEYLGEQGFVDVKRSLEVHGVEVPAIECLRVFRIASKSLYN